MEPAHARFVRAVRRRMILIRAVEHLGICISIGCTIAMLFLPFLLWRGESASFFLAMIGCLSGLAAVVLTIHRWPGELEAAEEADRQLNLADLLTTAVQLGKSNFPSDVMTESVLAMADARCASLSPSAVILNRFGARAWGGIVLVMATVVAVSLIPSHPIRTADAKENGSILDAPAQPVENSPPSKTLGHLGETPAGDESSVIAKQTDSGTGGEHASTNNSTQSASRADSNPGKATQSQTGMPSGGGASHNAHGVDPGIPGLGTRTVQRTIEPWQSTGNTTETPAIDPAGESIPAADRDLVRQFFQNK